jgi:hypothetical protein
MKWQIAESPDKGNSASCSGGSGHLRGLRADGIRLIARVKQAGGQQILITHPQAARLPMGPREEARLNTCPVSCTS